jgi:hypothetical protein
MDHRAQEVVLPWNLFDTECGEHIYIVDSDETQVVRFHKTQGDVAKRVVAYVNACRGISTEDLLTSDFGEDSIEVGALLGQTMQQRDELLEALKRATNHISEITNPVGKYRGLYGDVVRDSYAEAAAAFNAIKSVSNSEHADSEGGSCD